MNRLRHERSPYLLQHADNPVDWYPWSDEAFARAAEEGKPVFLSIGYSSCHWCHVMEEESFSDRKVAGLLNDSFVAVKVDREERPDIDSAYMAMAQVVVGQAGWPLTVIMTPDGRPFYIATYIPRESRGGQVGLLDLLPHVSAFWRDRKDELLESANRIISVTESVFSSQRGAPLSNDIVHAAVAQLGGQFDVVNGGFGNAPKFPVPSRLMLLLHHWWASGDRASLDMVTATLDAMRLGGIYDHVGAGFHRYSVDVGWNIPHFEKMLYDQALLTTVYVDAYSATGDGFYAATAREVLRYVMETLQSDGGGIRSSEDADSEGEEGKFYTWTVNDMESLLSRDELKGLLVAGGIMGEDDSLEALSEADRGGQLVLRLTARPDRLQNLSVDGQPVGSLVRSALTKLGKGREGRVRPGMDDKIVADWNGLAVQALARAGRALGEQSYVEAAVRCAEFVLTMMRDDSGRLYHALRGDGAAVPGFLEDYAFMADGLLDLFQATQEPKYLREAMALTSQMVELFWDDENGAFFQTGRDAKAMVVRTKPYFDGAMPSGNSIAASVLVRIGRLTDDAAMIEHADRLFSALSSLVGSSPGQFPQLLSAYMMRRSDCYVSIVVGDREDRDTRELIRTIDETYTPGTILVVVPADQSASQVGALVPAARDAVPVHGHQAAYVCSGSMCSQPVDNPEDLRELLKGRSPAG